MADQPLVEKGNIDPLSGDPAQYLINPVTQDVEFATTLSDAARLRDEQQFVPATAQQIDLFRKGYQALQKEEAERARVRAEPVKQRAAAFAERLGEFLNPADLVYGATRLPLPSEIVPKAKQAIKEALPPALLPTAREAARASESALRFVEPSLAEAMPGGVGTLEALKAYAKIERPSLAYVEAAAAPLVTSAIETKLGITTPEARAARAEEFPGMGWVALGASIVTPMGIEAALEKGALRAGTKAFGAAERAVIAEAEATRALDAVKAAAGPAVNAADARVLEAQEYLNYARSAGTPADIVDAEQGLAAAQRSAAQTQSIYDSAIATAEGRLSPELLPATTEAAARKAAAESFKAQEALVKASTDAKTYAARADLFQALGRKRAPTAMNLVSEGIGRPIVQAAEETTTALINRMPGANRAPQIIKDIVAKGVANGLGSAAEGAVFSLGQVANEDVLGPDHKLTGEQVLAAMEDGAWFGLKLGALAGAGMPAVKGVGDALSTLGGGLRDWTQKWYGNYAAERTGARRDTLDVAYDTRARFLEEDPGAVIEQEILARRPAPAEPVPPTPPEAPTPTPIPEKPLPYKPEVFPKFVPEMELGKPAPPKLRPADLDKAAFEFSDALSEEKAQLDSLYKSYNKEFAPAEDIPLVNEHYENLVRAERTKAKNDYLESIGGRTRSAAEHEALQAVMRDAVNEVNARPANELARLIEHAKGVVKTTVTNEPNAKPTGTIRMMKTIIKDLEKAATKAELPSDFADIIDVGKRRFYELGKEPKPNVVELSVEQVGREAARDAGKEFLLSRLDADLWGDAAARVERRNEAITDFDAARANLFNELSYTERKGVTGKTRQIDPAKVRKWLGNKDKPAGVRLNRAYDRYLAARDRLAYEFKVSTRAAEKETGLADVTDAIEQSAKAYSEAEAAVLIRAQNKMQAAEKKLFTDEIARLNEEIANRNEIAKREYDALKAEFDAAEGVKKEEAAGKIREWERIADKAEVADQIRLEAYKKQLKELDQAHAEEVRQWKQQLKDREADAVDQAKLLKSASAFGDPAENLAIGTVIKYSPDPVTKGIATAYKAGKIATANPIRTYKYLAWLEKKANSTRRIINEDVDNFIFGSRRGIKAVGMAGGMLSGDALDTEYERIKKEIRKLSTDAMARHAHLDAAVEGVGDVAPKAADAIKNTLATAQAVVEARVPKPPANLAPIAKANWRPTTAEKRKLVTTYDVVNNPKDAARRILAGASTADERQVMDDVYPAMMEMMRKRIIEKMRDNPQLDRTRAAIAGQILGVDLTGDLALGVSAQQQYQMQAPTPQDQQKKMKIGQGKALEGISGRAEYNTAARREAQQ